jgi:tryptophan synthase alpha chain
MTSGEKRIARVFETGKKPLVVAFTVAGDPDVPTSLAIMKEMAASGADIIELGLPWSDPVADGPVIQRADLRALSGGMNTDRLFDLVRSFRSGHVVPVVLLTYANPVLRRGVERFYREAADAGIDGVVIADVPLEESAPFSGAARASGIAPVVMVSPMTPPERISRIVSAGGGFIYLVAALGVTGVRQGTDPAAITLLAAVKARTTLPVAPGFGISSPAQVREWERAGADAVIVGSAIVRIIEKRHGDPEGIVCGIGEFIRALKQDCPENAGTSVQDLSHGNPAR